MAGSRGSYVLPFGLHEGKTLGEVGATPEGLRYLDLLREKWWLLLEAREAIEGYLHEEGVIGDLIKALDEGTA